jgi:hypothetical protein
MQKEPLKDIAARLRSAMRDIARQELSVAVEVMKLADSWAEREEEAKGRSINEWLRTEISPTRGLAWYKARADARIVLGAGFVESLEGAAALWMSHAISDAELDAAKAIVRTAYRKNKSVPLTLKQVKQLCRRYGGSKSRAQEGSVSRLWMRIRQLEEQLRDNGITPAEWKEVAEKKIG